jgi:hypothetical protein
VIARDARAVLSNLDRLQELRKDVRREEDLEQRAQLIDAVTEKVRKPQTFLDIARSDDIPIVGLDATAAEKTADAVSRLTVQGGGDPSAVLGNKLDDVLRSAEQLARAATGAAKAAWATQSQSEHWIEQRDLMLLLDANDISTEFGRVVRKLAELAISIVDLAACDIPTSSQYERWKHATEEFEQWYSRLWGESELPEDVVRFLREAHGASGAKLALVTETVRDWLDRGNLTRRYVVRVDRSV